MVNEMIIDSNTFYRITNSVLGSGFSLDVVNTDGPPTGEVDITPSGLFSGQVWQFINPTEPDNGPYYLSSSFLGAEKKLDFSIGADHTYIPLLKNFTATTDQTWIVKKHNDTVSGLNTTTYRIEPNYLNGTQALTANSTTKQPFLAVPGGGYQHWVLTPVMKINDASFSTSALWTMATQVSVLFSLFKLSLMKRPLRLELQLYQVSRGSDQPGHRVSTPNWAKPHPLPYPNQPSSQSY